MCLFRKREKDRDKERDRDRDRIRDRDRDRERHRPRDDRDRDSHRDRRDGDRDRGRCAKAAREGLQYVCCSTKCMFKCKTFNSGRLHFPKLKEELLHAWLRTMAY